MCRLAVITVALWLMSPLVAHADGSTNTLVEPATLWKAWNWDLLILLNLGLLGIVYVLGLRRLWRRTGVGRCVGRWQATAYLISLGVLFVALISPLHALSEELAAAHMVQHMLLMVVAAPLFAFGSPGQVLIWGLESNWRPRVARWSRLLNAAPLEQPLVLWLLHAAVLWLWHWPPAYQTALVDPLVHDVQHLSFFAAACLYWRVLLDPLRRRGVQPLTAVASLFATSLVAMLLGIFMALSHAVWYDTYISRTAIWGLSPLEDQQFAGFIMWMPACLVYPALAAVLLGHWLATLPHQRPPRERRQPCVELETLTGSQLPEQCPQR